MRKEGRDCFIQSLDISDTHLASTTHEEMKLSPSIGFVIFIDYYNGLRMSQLIMMNYQMCESPSLVMGGGNFLSQWLVLDGLPSKANVEFTNESNFSHDSVGSYGCR